MDRGEPTDIADPAIPREQLIHLCQDLQERVLQRRCELEGVDPNAAWFKAFYMGMGAWAGKGLKVERAHENIFQQ